MYKQEKIVVEDAVVGKNCPGSKHYFTGGKSELELPVTVSFLDEGEYKVHITSGHIFVNRVEDKEPVEKILSYQEIHFRLAVIDSTLKESYLHGDCISKLNKEKEELLELLQNNYGGGE